MRKLTMTVVICAMLAACLLLSGASALADDDDQERELSANEDQYGFHISSTSMGYELVDSFAIDFEDSVLSISYQGIDEQDEDEDWELELEFDELVEFQDNGNGYLDPDDETVSSISLEDVGYRVMSGVGVLPEGGTRTTFTVVYEGDILNITLAVSTSPYFRDGRSQSPCDIGIGVEIRNYPYHGDGTLMALQISVEADIDSELEYEDDDDGAELSLLNSAAGGSITWPTTATVDGAPAQVVAAWDEESVSLTFPPGSTITHESTISITSLAVASGPIVIDTSGWNPLLYTAGLLMAGGLVGGMVLVQRWRNR